MNTWLTFMAMVGAVQGDTGAPPQLDCGELGAMVAAARARPPFAAFPAASAASGPMLGLGASCYRYEVGVTALYCHLIRAGGLRREGVADQIDACLPDALRGPETPSPSPERRASLHDAGVTYFRAGDVSLRLSNSASATIIGYQLYLRIRRDQPGADREP